jgi:septum formation protein
MVRQAVMSEENKLPISQPIFLASTSPRRAEILRAVGWPFELVRGSVDETRLPDENPTSYVRRLAEAKAQTAANELTAGVVLGADTTVVVEGELLGQPVDDEDARRMLRLLSGKWHEVMTGIALIRAGLQGENIVAHETTRVRFKPLTEAEIDWYVASGEPRGKAGAYAVQGRAAVFIEEISGDYFNIVGLPIQLVYTLFRSMQPTLI